jgi:Fic family protein
MRKTGHCETLGTINYFIPDPLPPQNPPLTLDHDMMTLYGEAMLHLGKLNEMTNRLPDIQRFIRAYIIKEALLSSAIEGIHTTMLDVFTQPLLNAKPSKDTQLVMNYTQALYTTITLIKKEDIPVSNRVLLAAHKVLMQGGEGDKSDPGHYRKQAVKVGNLVPPPAHHIQEHMAHLEQFIHSDESLPPLIKAGLAHVQFETIHPFLDGNGRIGRLLIVLMIISNELLREPILYPSYYFKKHHFEYYQILDSVRTAGNFEAWITFYLKAIKESSIDACTRAQDIEILSQHLINLIEKKFAKTRETRLQALSIIFSSPIININQLSDQLDISFNTSNQIISEFVDLNILVEETKQKRSKLFKFKPYLEILEKEYVL